MTDNLAKGWLDELKFITADEVIGVAENELLNSGMTKVGKHLDMPLRIYASTPADAWVNIGPSRVERGDGVGKVAPPVEDIVDDRSATAINMQTGSLVGDAVTLQGDTFALPLTTVGQYRRMVMVHQPQLNNIDIIFSDATGSVAGLTNVGTLLAQLDGNPIGLQL